jgi:hypothetical protein
MKLKDCKRKDQVHDQVINDMSNKVNNSFSQSMNESINAQVDCLFYQKCFSQIQLYINDIVMTKVGNQIWRCCWHQIRKEG